MELCWWIGMMCVLFLVVWCGSCCVGNFDGWWLGYGVYFVLFGDCVGDCVGVFLVIVLCVGVIVGFGW